MRRRHHPQPVGAFVPRALKDLGVLSARVGAALEGAWLRVADPAWQPYARPARLQGGVLEVAVSSAPLREELAQFHAPRLLTVLREALPTTTLLGLRFVAAGERSAADRAADGGADVGGRGREARR